MWVAPWVLGLDIILKFEKHSFGSHELPWFVGGALLQGAPASQNIQPIETVDRNLAEVGGGLAYLGYTPTSSERNSCSLDRLMNSAKNVIEVSWLGVKNRNSWISRSIFFPIMDTNWQHSTFKLRMLLIFNDLY